MSSWGGESVSLGFGVFLQFVSSLSHAVFRPKANLGPLAEGGGFREGRLVRKEGQDLERRGFFSPATFSIKNKEGKGKKD